MYVRPKKKLGQHFLTDLGIAERIAGSLPEDDAKTVVEVGGGTGVLTDFLIGKYDDFYVMDVDAESVEFLRNRYPDAHEQIIEGDFLKLDIPNTFPEGQIAVIGNFPYNISSQILFKVLDNRDSVSSLTGMFQKEVAERIAASHGSKTYGILSVLAQVYYDVEYLFTVPPEVFNPPPKVQSGVIRLIKRKHPAVTQKHDVFRKMVKAAFGQRRKMMSNSLKAYFPDKDAHDFLKKRPEQVSVNEFVDIFNVFINRKSD